MAFKAVFGSDKVGSRDGQRNLGIHLLRYSYVVGAVARQACGKKNALSHQMREDGHIRRDQAFLLRLAWHDGTKDVMYEYLSEVSRNLEVKVSLYHRASPHVEGRPCLVP